MGTSVKIRGKIVTLIGKNRGRRTPADSLKDNWIH